MTAPSSNSQQNESALKKHGSGLSGSMGISVTARSIRSSGAQGYTEFHMRAGLQYQLQAGVTSTNGALSQVDTDSGRRRSRSGRRSGFWSLPSLFQVRQSCEDSFVYQFDPISAFRESVSKSMRSRG